MSFCEHCIQGVRHEGTPEGTWEEFDGIKAYVATPTIDYPKDKVLLYIPDVFGIQLPNHQLLADDFARNGLKVVVPDIFDEPCPADALDPGSNFDLGKWFGTNGPQVTEPRVRKVLAALKASGITRVGVTGYCYGARLGFNLAFENEIDVLVVAHPSLLNVPDDIEKYKSSSKAPLLINSCTVDTQFPHEKQEITDGLLGEGKFAPGYLRTYWEGCTHGFAVRGDLSDPKVKAGKEGAFKASVEWLIKYL
ncbi:alpha/beta-hydrolase [Trametopsis cervina]|nr:alpha/beta-hydrolase [Trametopsis cervina]